MSNSQLDLYKYLSEVVLLPTVQDIITSCGGIIDSKSVLWPLTTFDGRKLYYTINFKSNLVYFQGKKNESKNELVVNEGEAQYVLSHLVTTIKLSMILATVPDLQDPVFAIMLGQNPKNIQFFIKSSMS